MQNLYSELREFRLKKGIAQIQLAFVSEIQNGYLSKIERGWESPSLMTLEKLSLGFKRLKIDAKEVLAPLIAEAKKRQDASFKGGY